jgi:hypothetical protein
VLLLVLFSKQRFKHVFQHFLPLDNIGLQNVTLHDVTNSSFFMMINVLSETTATACLSISVTQANHVYSCSLSSTKSSSSSCSSSFCSSSCSGSGSSRISCSSRSSCSSSSSWSCWEIFVSSFSIVVWESRSCESFSATSQSLSFCGCFNCSLLLLQSGLLTP